MLAGAQLTGLLFFLNPHIPFQSAPILRGVLYYGSLLGFLSLLIYLGLNARRPLPPGIWLPSSVTLVLAAFSLAAWVHALYFVFFLPTGIHRRLLKAAILLTLAALVCFYTTLIHRLRQRPFGRRSLLLILAMAAISIYVVLERRVAFRPTVRPAPRATTFEGTARPFLGVVGLDSATFDAILPLEEQGRLPFLSQILQEGAHTRLKSLRPVRKTALWTTLSTGRLPHRHGVVGSHLYDAKPLAEGQFFKLLPLAVGFEQWGILPEPKPIDSVISRTLSLWDIFSRIGIPTGLVGWPLTSPPPTGVHTVLPDRFFDTEGVSGLVVPEDLGERARLFRTQIEEIDPVYSDRFGPQPPRIVLESLAQDLWRRDLGLVLLDQDPQIDTFFLMLPGLGRVSSQYFGGFSAVQFEGIQAKEAEEASQQLSAYYTQIDEVLAEVWAAMPEPRLLVLVSVHGIEGPEGWRELRRRLLRKTAIEGYVDGAPDGILLFFGDGIRAGAMPKPANLVDLVPTLLYGMGLPIARDLDGNVLTDAFEPGFLARQPLTLVPSYETLADPGS